MIEYLSDSFDFEKLFQYIPLDMDGISLDEF